MRRVFLWVTFPLLVAGLLVLWCHRFERMPSASEVCLAELRTKLPVLPAGAEWQGSAQDPVLRLVVSPENPRVRVRMELPGVPPIEAFLIRFRMKSKNLTAGEQVWEDGRALIEWRSSDGTVKLETDAVATLCGDTDSGDTEVVIRPANGRSIPVLWIEHLGRGGEFEISRLEMIPLRERVVWKFGQWLLAAAWLVWIWMFLRMGGNRSRWMSALAAVIWVVAAVFTAVPGPWKNSRSLVIPFKIGPPVALMAGDERPTGDAKSISHTPALRLPEPIYEVPSRIPIQDSWIVKVKYYLSMLRPILHALLLFLPALAFAFLLNRKSAIMLAVGLAVAIEVAQTAFGYGFGWDDVGDLVTDAIGIALALWVWERIGRRCAVGRA
jgi:hypothetical protein